MNISQNLVITLIVGLVLGFLVGKSTGHRYQGVCTDTRIYVVDQVTGDFYYIGGDEKSFVSLKKVSPLDGSATPIYKSPKD